MNNQNKAFYSCRTFPRIRLKLNVNDYEVFEGDSAVGREGVREGTEVDAKPVS